MPAVLKGPTAVPVLDVPTVPLQPSDPEPPLAVQEVAFVVDHDKVVPCPVVRLVEAALKAPIEAAEPGGLMTLRVVELGAPVPPGPVQSKV